MSAALEIVVTAYAGEPISVPIVGKLKGRAGLTIGRNPSNDLVLDDPARQVSRFQAKVAEKRASVELSNVSNQSCILVNGLEIKPGESAKIHPGDKIVMGRYLLELKASEPDSQQAENTAPSEPAIAEEPWNQPDVTLQESILQIPDDYDVFAVPGGEESPPAELQVNSLEDFNDSQSKALLQELGSTQTVGEEDLFEKKRLDKGALLELVEDKLDPMQLFGATATKAVPETIALDHTPEMESLIKLPVYEEIKAPLLTGNSTNQPTTSEPGLPPETITENTTAEIDQATVTAVVTPDPDPPPPPPVQDTATDNEPQGAALKKALAEGCGLPSDTMPEITPELMQHLGTILKALSDGTVRLMHSRSMTKHEMRANVTIIASAGNNPIKFAPDGAAALQQMLGKRFNGFMPPIEAIEDAFDDLSAHQLGLLAGARSAALELFEKLSPDQTVANHETPGMLEGLLPFIKDATLWRQHKRRYKKFADDKEGFANLIEKSFVKSYEDEIERIYSGRDQ